MNTKETMTHIESLPKGEGVAMAAILLAFILDKKGKSSEEAESLIRFLEGNGVPIKL